MGYALLLIFCLISLREGSTIDDYDISGLQSKGPFNTSINNYSINFNINKEIGLLSNGSECDSISDCSICYYQLGQVIQYCCGRESTDVLTVTDDGTGYYARGAVQYRNSSVYVKCSDLTQITAKLGQTYFIDIEFLTPYGCIIDNNITPQGRRMKEFLGVIFCISFLGLVVIYFVVGVPLMILVFKKRGLEIFPFFLHTLGLVKDGVLCICSPFCFCHTRSSYQTL